MAKTPKLAEIAERILAHLKRIEKDLKLNPRRRPGGLLDYYNVNCFPAGARIEIVYVSYQGWSYISKVEALAYLAWLDAGNVGKHWEVPGG